MVYVKIYICVFVLLCISDFRETMATTLPTSRKPFDLTTNATSLENIQPSSTNSENTTLPINPFLSILTNFGKIFNSSANPTTPSKTSLPVSLVAMQNKLPGAMQTPTGGIQNLILSQLMGKTELDFKTAASLFSGLAPKLPSLLKKELVLNTSALPAARRKCFEDLNSYTRDLLSGKMWALKMMDASGKPGPSILDGNLKFFGNFDECLDVDSGVSMVDGRSVKGDTCSATLSPPPQLKDLAGPQTGGFGSVSVSISWHLCLPDSCSGTHVQPFLNKSLSKLNITVARVQCHVDIKNGPIGNDKAAVGAIVLVAILCFLVVLGSALDLDLRAKNNQKQEEPSTEKLHVISPKANTDNPQDDETQIPDGKGGARNGNLNTGFELNELGLKTAEAGNNVVLVQINGLAERTIRKNPVDKPKPIKAPVWQRLLLCFSAVTNGEKILSVKHAPGTLTCLNGIRVLSICWVILGHTFLFFFGDADNPITASKLKTTFGFQMIISGTLSVDSFFVLSGLLVTYLFLKETEKAGGIRAKHMVMYYVHRYLRLTPTYAFVIFINTCLVRYFVDGPFWNGPSDSRWCEKNWWTNILYINNVYKEDRQCVAWGWYLANDMQFYIVAPLALVPFAFGKKSGHGSIMKVLGLCVTAAFLITSIISTAVITYNNSGDLLNNTQQYFLKVYQKPWCRIGPFAIGMGLGYILQVTKSKIRISIFVQSIGWLTALVAAITCVFSTYDENAEGRSVWGPGAMAAHEALFRPGWGLVVGWVILMCCTSKAGVINWILSWDWWQPLARLTYGAYLVHMIIMQALNMNIIRTLIHYTASYMVLHFFGYVCLAYIFAFIVAILVEAPLLQLEKLMLS